ncbi:MAG TPA: hypothetical protein VGR12_04855, partial [Solirubrobacteraceae bacterium]|nr:hypothetical protein [Solirubrobacteraceae bacterium]
MSLNRSQIAAGATLVALGGLAAVALVAGGGQHESSAAAAAPPAEVRTEIVRRTIRVRKPVAAAPAEAAAS